MISHELQYRVHLGDSEAFKTLFSMCGRAVYFNALCGLNSVSGARSVVKRVFLRLQHELMEAPGPIDVDARIAVLTRDELARYTAGQSAARTAGTARTWGECMHAPQPPPAPPTAPPCAPPVFSGGPVISVEPPMTVQSAAILESSAADCPAAAAQSAAPAPRGASGPALREGLPPRPAAPPPQCRRVRPGIPLLWLMVAVLALLLVWLMLDILMHLKILTRVDLGYTWFNEHMFRLFSLQ